MLRRTSNLGIVVIVLALTFAPALAGPAESIVRVATHGAGGGIPRFVDPFEQLGRLQGDLENIYEPLIYPYRDTFELKGVLAESWTSTSGGALWTFKLRKNVRFHDGSELTAEAVKLSFERMREVGRSAAANLLTDVRDVRVVDPLTVQFALRLAGGPPFLPRLTSLVIVSAKALKDHANDPAWLRTNEAGTGPYVLEEFVPRDRMVLRRFDGYWGPQPFFSRAVFLEILEPATQALMIQRGEVDIAYNLPPQSLAQMKQNPQLRVLQVPGDRVMNFRLNVSAAPFNNKALRKAVAYAMDYNALLRARSEEISAPEGPVPRKYLNGWVPPNLITRQNLERARQLLAEAGYRPGQLNVTLNIAAGSAVQANAAEVFQSSLQQIGINARINAVDFFAMLAKLQRFAKTKDPADSEDTMTLIRGPFIPHAAAYFSSYEAGSLNNYFDYGNSRIQQLFELGYATERRDAERALENYKQAIEMVVDDQADLWLYVEKRLVVMRSNIQGYYMHPVWFPETHVFPLSRR